MPYTKDQRGVLDNFAQEPKVYRAEPPTNSQQRNYVLWGIGAIILLSGVLYVTFMVSSI